MWREEDKIINGLYFKQTCVIAPEQYDVFLDGKYVAYVRCRWGKLRVNPVNIELTIQNVANILDFDYLDEEDFHNVYKVYNEKSKKELSADNIFTILKTGELFFGGYIKGKGIKVYN